MAAACGGGTPPRDDEGAPADRGAPTDGAGAVASPTGGTPAGRSGATPDAEPDRTDPDLAAIIDGVRWTVDTAVIDGRAAPVPAGPSQSAWLLVDGGTFVAVTGCGEVEGRVRVGDGHLWFSDVTQTIAVHCPEEFAQADRVMRELLASEADFAVEDGQLRLAHASGIGLRLHAGQTSPPEE